MNVFVSNRNTVLPETCRLTPLALLHLHLSCSRRSCVTLRGGCCSSICSAIHLCCRCRCAIVVGMMACPSQESTGGMSRLASSRPLHSESESDFAHSCLLTTTIRVLNCASLSLFPLIPSFEFKSMTPAYEDASRIPYLLPSHCTKLKMTHTRKKQLLKAANRDWNNPPTKPGNDECCGSHCSPCVKDLWTEEVVVWKQRWGLRDDVAQVNKMKPTKMPGS